MDLLAAETAIIERLKTQIVSGLSSNLSAPRVDSFPQDPRQHFENLSPTGEILVRFNDALGSDPDPNRNSVIVQNFIPNWSIWIVMPNLVTHTGIYNWIEKVKDALTGWTITGWDDSTPLYCNNIGFIDEKGGNWFYEMNFTCETEESEI